VALIRHRKVPRIVRFSRRLQFLFRDKYVIAFIAMIISGLILFQISSITPLRILEKVPAGNAFVSIEAGRNSTVYFSNIAGDQSVIDFMLPSGVTAYYWVYAYAYIQTFFGYKYVQDLVMQGTVKGNMSVYLPQQYRYVDMNYFLNLTGTSEYPAQGRVSVYSEFYQIQPFQFPEEIGGTTAMIAGIIALAARLTVLNERIK
jgi:hypothetical protein